LLVPRLDKFSSVSHSLTSTNARDERQVTPVGAAMPNLYVRELSSAHDGSSSGAVHSSFKIAGGLPNGRVHFHVMAAFVEK
jgi:hypothetical protein